MEFFMLNCPHCKTENPEVNSKCFNCGEIFPFAMLECISGEGEMKEGTKWNLAPQDYIIGRSKSCDITIPGSFVSRNHCHLRYHSEEKIFYYESLGKNTLDFEKGKYKIFNGAILPFPETIELKLIYVVKT